MKFLAALQGCQRFDEETSLFFNISSRLRSSPLITMKAEQFIHEKSREAGFTKEEKAHTYGNMRKRVSSNGRRYCCKLWGKMLLEDKQQQVKKGPDYRQHF